MSGALAPGRSFFRSSNASENRVNLPPDGTLKERSLVWMFSLPKAMQS